MFHVSAFLFWCWLCFWHVLFCYFLVFVLLLLLLSQTMKNTVFPAILVYFSHVGYKVVLYFFSFWYWFLFVFFVLFVSILDIWFALFCDCVVWFFSFKDRTTWFCCLHLVVFFPFLLFCFESCLFSFSHSSRKKTPKKLDTAKKTQNQKCRKKGETKKSASAIVFTNSVPNYWGVGYKNVIFAENPL